MNKQQIEKVKRDLAFGVSDRCFRDPYCGECDYYGSNGVCNFNNKNVMRDALSVIESLSSNEGAIEVLHSSGWMQNHDHEITADGTLFMKWLAELMLNTDDEPIKPSEIINRIDQGGFRRFVDDWKDGDQP